MRFHGLDLNLLVALDALLETRSVARAAERLNLSQPATSSALARLREYFQDELLTVHGKRMYPTAAAESIAPQVQACLQSIQHLISASTAFDSATSTRCFRIIVSDYMIAAVLAPLVRKLTTTAPGIQFQFLAQDMQSSEMLDRGEVDLLILPADYTAVEHPTRVLFEERYVVVGDKHHPIFRGGVTEEAIFQYGHVVVGFGNPPRPTFGDHQIEMLRKSRKIDISMTMWTLAPWLLLDSERLAIMHERLARTLIPTFALSYAPLPLDLPVMKQVAQFHKARARDEGLMWLISELTEISAISAPPEMRNAELTDKSDIAYLNARTVRRH